MLAALKYLVIDLAINKINFNVLRSQFALEVFDSDPAIAVLI